MSRGGRRGGGFSGRDLPPMGLTFADIQNMSREAAELYPTLETLPALTSITDEERKICELQNGFAARLRASKYFLVETKKSDDLPRYSDKYRPSPAAQPTLKRKDLHQPFFPSEIFEDYFNPKRKKREKKKSVKKVNLDGIEDANDDEEKSSEKSSNVGSDIEGSDYDVEEEYDNDYAENYFDNGEGDDMDDLGDGGGDGGGGDYE